MQKGTLTTVSIIAALMVALTGTSAAVVQSGGASIETSGMKISLDLKSSTGAKIVFQRAG